MKREEIKELLEIKYQQFNSTGFIESDPIQIPHQFQRRQDIEIIGFLTAIIAWGNRTAIIKSGRKLVEIMQGSPYDFILNLDEEGLSEINFVHRTFQPEDLRNFFRAFHRYYQENATLEDAFLNGETTAERIHEFKKIFSSTFTSERTLKHLADPMKGSSAKRINMFLRWMVRKDHNSIDFGLWERLPVSELHLPLDVHTGNVARKLKLLKRKQNDWKAVEEITRVLQKFDPQDPCKYDYALFGLGAFENF